MLAATAGEHHILGLRMAADVLEGAGYEVMYLGADAPLGSLLGACSRHRPAVLALTVSMCAWRRQSRPASDRSILLGLADASASSLTTRLAADRALYIAKQAGRNQIAATPK
jgi:hypothetical protein